MMVRYKYSKRKPRLPWNAGRGTQTRSTGGRRGGVSSVTEISGWDVQPGLEHPGPQLAVPGHMLGGTGQEAAARRQHPH